MKGGRAHSSIEANANNSGSDKLWGPKRAPPASSALLSVHHREPHPSGEFKEGSGEEGKGGRGGERKC